MNNKETNNGKRSVFKKNIEDRKENINADNKINSIKHDMKLTDNDDIEELSKNDFIDENDNKASINKSMKSLKNSPRNEQKKNGIQKNNDDIIEKKVILEDINLYTKTTGNSANLDLPSKQSQRTKKKKLEACCIIF
jgi:hypothetical protein